MPSLAMEVSNRAGRLADIFDDLRSKATEKQAKATAEKVRGNIRKHGLIKTGRMLGSVKAEREGPALWDVRVTATSAKGFPYPAIQNSGGRYIKATHFFDEARVDAEHDYPRTMIGEIRSGLG